MILIDSNVFVFAAGADHPFKKPSVRFLELVARREVDAAIDAEVLQEILWRYRAIKRWQDGRRVFDMTRRIVPRVVPITAEIAERARRLMDVHEDLVARDAIHAACCLETGARAICSYDEDFDAIPAVERFTPDRLP